MKQIPELQEFPVAIEIDVAWGDMDAFQHVNNAMYFRYFESGRIMYLREIDFAQPEKHNSIGPILGHTQCKFLRALTYPDKIIVGVRTIEMRDDRFIVEMKIYSTKLKQIAAVGTADMVAFNYVTNQKAELPHVIRQKIESLEKRRF